MMRLEAIERAPKVTKKDGYIPAVYYGAHAKSTPIFVRAIDFTKAHKEAGESSTIVLATPSGEELALIHDIQRHPVKHTPAHIDFYIVEKGQKVHVNVPITFVGEAPAVKQGGILVKVMHELSVEAPASALPHEVTVDLEKLIETNSVITVSDIVLPSNVSIYHLEPTDVVASIAVAKEEEETPVQAPDLSTIEVEKKGKKEDEEVASEE